MCLNIYSNVYGGLCEESEYAYISCEECGVTCNGTKHTHNFKSNEVRKMPKEETNKDVPGINDASPIKENILLLSIAVILIFSKFIFGRKVNK